MTTIDSYPDDKKMLVASAMPICMEAIGKADQQGGVVSKERIDEKREMAFCQAWTDSGVDQFKSGQKLIDSLLCRGEFQGHAPTPFDVKTVAMVKDKPADLWAFIEKVFAAVTSLESLSTDEKTGFFSFCLSNARDVAVKGRESEGVISGNVTAKELLCLGKLALKMGFPETTMGALKTKFKWGDMEDWKNANTDVGVTPYGDDSTPYDDKKVGDLPFNPLAPKPESWIPKNKPAQ